MVQQIRNSQVCQSTKLPEVTTAVGGTAKALGLIEVFSYREITYVLSTILNTIRVVKGQLGSSSNILQGEEAQIVEWLVGVIRNNGKDAQVGVAGMVDEAGWTGTEFTIYLVRLTSQAGVRAIWIVKLVKGEEVDVLLGSAERGSTSAFSSFAGCDDLTDIAPNVLTTFDIVNSFETCGTMSILSLVSRRDGTYPSHDRPPWGKL